MAAKGDILVVDDLKRQGDIISGHIKERRGYRAILPESVKELVQSILFAIYEGAMIDVVWGKEWSPLKLKSYKWKIQDGVDFARFIFDLNPKMAESIALYSTVADLNEPDLNHKIERLPFKPKLIPTPLPWNRVQAQKKIDPLLAEASKVRKANPLLQPPEFIDLPLNDRILTYKSIYSEYSKWIDFHFDTIGDYSWGVMCGAMVEKGLYGMPINGGNYGYPVEALAQYPDEKTLKSLSKKRDFFPFIFWNARKPELLGPQFEMAGPGLSKIPDKWRSFFSIAMARQCSKAYIGGQERQVLDWCRELNEVGKVEITKQIYKLLRRESPRADVEKFAQMAETRELPVIADILLGKVDHIDREKGLARVAMRTHDDDAFVEVMKLERLERANVRFVDTWFEYTVYQLPRGEVVANIEPVDPEEVDK